MSRSVLKVLLLGALTVVGWTGLWLYESRMNDTRLRASQAQREAEQRNERLRQIGERLDLDRRVARVIVTGQESGPGGAPRTTLLFIEYARDRRNLLPARRLVVEGKATRVIGHVIRFAGDYAIRYADDRRNEPLRGRTLLLLRGMYGDQQQPNDAAPIDPPGGIPDVYKSDDPRQAEGEKSFWEDSWKVAEDAGHRAVPGRVTDAEAVMPDGFQPGYIHTLTLTADGRLHVRSDPIDPAEARALQEGARAVE
jgi:hypothetical protein